MRKLSILLVTLFLLVGCVGNSAEMHPEPVEGANNRPTTLFGALSERFSFGETKEKIAYKLIHPDGYLLTVTGEVLMDKPAWLEVDIISLNDNKDISNLDMTIVTCAYNDQDAWNWGEPENCSDNLDAITVYENKAVYTENGTFRVEGFVWNVYADWTGLLIINDAEPIGFKVEVYEPRPPTTTGFELGSLTLPFATIVIFLFLVRMTGSKLIRPIHNEGKPA